MSSIQILYQLIKRVKRIILPYVFVIIFSFVQGFTTSLNVLSVFPLFNFLTQGDSDSSNFVLSAILKVADYLNLGDPLIASCILLFFVSVLNLFLFFWLQYFIGITLSRSTYEVKKEVFKKFSKQNFQYFIMNKHGRLQYDLFLAPLKASSMFSATSELIATTFRILFLFVLIVSINWIFTVYLMLFLGIYIVSLNLISSKVIFNLADKRVEYIRTQRNIANDFLNGIKQIHIYLAKQRWLSDFNKFNLGQSDIIFKLTLWTKMPKQFLEFCFYVFIVIVVIIAKVQAVPVAHISSIAIYAAALMRMLPYVSAFSVLRLQIVEKKPDAKAILDVLDLPDQENLDLGDEFKGFSDKIVFKNVCFAYPGRPTLLKGLDLLFEKNKTTALVGASGSGKTTIINIILKLLTPQEGCVEVDKVNLNAYSMQSWLEKIGFVSQDLFVFNGTIADNITFKDPRYSLQDVIEATKVAQIHEFIEDLPDKYGTNVGEKGMRLSIGQQQRIAIARALIRKPEILILDEPTSSLDNISEEMFQKAVDALSKRMTIILVAHRLTTVKKADSIVFLKEGVKCEEGTHQELLTKKGEYWKLYNREY